MKYDCYFYGTCYPTPIFGSIGVGLSVSYNDCTYEKMVGYPKAEIDDLTANYKALLNLLKTMENKVDTLINIFTIKGEIFRQMNQLSPITEGLHQEDALLCFVLINKIQEKNILNLDFVPVEKEFDRVRELSIIACGMGAISNQIESKINLKSKK